MMSRNIAVIVLFSLMISQLKMYDTKLVKLKILSKAPVCEVENRFLSVAVSIGQAQRNFTQMNFTSPRLKTLLSALKPAYFRFGGSAANFLFFKVGSQKPSTPPIIPVRVLSSATTKPPKPTSKPVTVTPKVIPGSGTPKQGNTPSPNGPMKTLPPNGTPYTPNVPIGASSTSNQKNPAASGNAGQGQSGNMPSQNNQQNGQQPPGQSNQQSPNQQAPSPVPPTSVSNNLINSNSAANLKPAHYASGTKDGINGIENDDENESGMIPYAKENNIYSGDVSSRDGAEINNGDYQHIDKRTLVRRGKITEPFWFMSDDFDRLYNFVNSSGLNLIFNLGQFVRYNNGSWNSTNALDLLRHVAYRQFNVGWQLGNEPNSYKKYGTERQMTGKQDGEDAVDLRRILRSDNKFGTLLVGPDVTRPRAGSLSEAFLRDYLNTNASSEVSAVSWHQYYVNGRSTTDKEMVDPDTLDLLKDQILEINKIMDETKAKKPVWLTETGSAWGGGAPGLSDTFAASFMYLDKLGLAGVFCHSVVMRQSFVSGNYAMLDDDYTPRPDYWLALLHKRLMGNKVLLVSGDTKKVRAYAHCTKMSTAYPAGAVSVIVMNLRNKPVRIRLAKELKGKEIDQFLVTSSDGRLTTKEVLLNGEKLKLESEDKLPELQALKVKQPMKMPSFSYAFYVIPDAGNKYCK